MKKVLVAYGSKYGNTAEIAEKIGKQLNESGFETIVKSAKEIKDVSDYDAVILGNAAYVGGWPKETVKLLKSNKDVLKHKAVWIFSSGPTGKGDPVEMVNGWKYPNSVSEIIKEVKPRDITVFHGKLDENQLNFIHKLMIKQVKAEIGDYRDWDAIAQWTEKIIEELK